MERLRIAKELHKYGALETWQELFVYSMSIADTRQRQEIGGWAKKFNHGDNIRLPLKDNR